MQKRSHFSIADAYYFLVLGLHDWRIMSIVSLENPLALSDRWIRAKHTWLFCPPVGGVGVGRVVVSTTLVPLAVLPVELPASVAFWGTDVGSAITRI